MKALSVVAAVAVLLLFLAPAAEAQPQFQQVIEVKVKIGQERAFEDWQKKIIEANDKAGTSTSWGTYQVVVGKPSPTYHIVAPFDKWAERDDWQNLNELFKSAFGEKEAERLMSVRTSVIESVISRIWRILPDRSANLAAGGSPANFYEVTVMHIKPEMVPEYQLLLLKFTEAYEAADSKPIVIRSILQFGESARLTFRRAAPFNKWSDQDSLDIPKILHDHFGEDERESQNNTVQRSLVARDTFIVAYRPDLSRSAGVTPTNEP